MDVSGHEPKGIVALRASVVERVRASCVASLEAGDGAIIFVAGPPASGRSAVLQELTRVLAKGPNSPRVVAGTIVEGRYVAAQPDTERGSVAADAVISALGLGGAALPVLGLVEKVASLSRAVGRAVRSPASSHQPRILNELMGVLRTASREQPLVCLVDDADEADGRWWSELLLGFAEEVARDLPLVLVLTLEGDDNQGPHPDDGNQPDALFAARDLVARGLAEWWPLTPLGSSELAALTGDAESEVLVRLGELTEGRARLGGRPLGAMARQRTRRTRKRPQSLEVRTRAARRIPGHDRSGCPQPHP